MHSLRINRFCAAQRSHWFLLVILLLLLRSQGDANTYNFPCTVDATVKSAFPTQNFGSETSLFAGYSGTTNGNGRTFLMFDLSSFPPNEMDYITDIYLYMTVTQSSTSTAFYIWQVGGSWNEGTLTWNNQPGLGGNIENTGSWGSTGYRYIWLSRLGNAWFRNWLSGTDPNYGLILKNGNEGSPSSPAAFFTSTENADPSKPMLRVVTSVAPSPSITVTSPNGGESWRRGETHLITWNSVNVAWAEKIQVEYSPLIGGSEILIHEVSPNSTSDAWTIPSDALLSSQYRILLRVIYHSTIYAQDWSNSTFSVGEALPPNRTLSVNATNSGGAVTIAVVPTNNCSGNSTPFTCSYPNGTNVNLTAPGTSPSGNTFQKWQQGGTDFSSNQSVTISMIADYTMTAVYTTPTTRTLTVNSQNPSSGVSIVVSPVACPGGTSTSFTCNYNNGTSVNLTAPATSPTGTGFQKWQLDGADYSFSLATSVVMSANHTMTVIYSTPITRTLSVQSTNPNSGLAITVSPANCPGGTTTGFTCTYNNGTTVNLTAPASSGTGSSFQKWLRDGADYSTSNEASIVMDSDHTMTAVYQTSYQLVVQSTPSNCPISYTDFSGTSNCNTSCNLTYISGQAVTLSAPQLHQSQGFDKWQLDNVDQPAGQLFVNVTMNASHTAKALYRPLSTIGISAIDKFNSQQVSVAMNCTPDNSGTSSFSTPATLTYFDQALVTVTAPSEVAGRYFLKWTVDGQTVTSNPLSLQVVSANHQVTAEYAAKSILIKDVLGHAIVNKSGFVVSKVLNVDPFYPEVRIGGSNYTFSTDTEGKIYLPVNAIIAVGDWIKVEFPIYAEWSRRHSNILATMYTRAIDNAGFDRNSGATYGDIRYNSIDGSPEQVILLDRTTLKFNLVVSIEWDALPDYISNLQAGFRLMSNYLYDVSDGQMMIDTVRIYDDFAYWSEADIKIHADNTLWPQASPAEWERLVGVGGTGIYSLWYKTRYTDHIMLPRIFYGGWKSANADSAQVASKYPYDWAKPCWSCENYLRQDYPGSRVIAHEFGHYALGFWDEYENASGVTVQEDFNFGYMDENLDHFDLLTHAVNSQSSEMSSMLQYDGVTKNTAQWENLGMSCWDWINHFFAWHGTGTSGVPSQFSLPTAFPYESVFFGPNDDVSNPNHDVGSRVVFPEQPQPTTAITKFIKVFIPSTPQVPAGGVEVHLYSLADTDLYQGKTHSESGVAIILGLKPWWRIGIVGKYRYSEFTPRSVGTGNSNWLFASLEYDGGRISSTTNEVETLDDTVNVVLRSVQGDYPLVWIPDVAMLQQTISVRGSKLFSQSPILFLDTDEGVHSESWMSASNGTYTANIDDSLSSAGRFTFWAVDDSGTTYPVVAQYVRTTNPVFAPSGSASGDFLLHLDSSNQWTDNALIVSTEYPPLLTGLKNSDRLVGRVHSFSVGPLSILYGNNFVKLSYDQNDVLDTVSGVSSEIDLKMCSWDNSLGTWTELVSQVDTTANEVTAPISGPGVLALILSTPFDCGDADGNEIVSISDAVYLINYIFAGGHAPDPVESGDVDCNGIVTISDAVYLINYIFAGGAQPCAACQ